VASRKHTGRIAIAAALLALGALLGRWVLGVATNGGDDTDRATGLDAHTPRPRPHSVDTPARRPALDRLRDRLHAPKPDAEKQRAARLARFKVHRLFDKDCMFGVDGHCKTWGKLARRCDDGDTAACVRLGKLLVGQSPAQPLWGSLLLRKACAQANRADVCDLGEKWNRWSRYGYMPKDDGEPTPDDLDAACDAGDQVACGLIQMRNSHCGRMDEVAALASCRAGCRDVCATLFTSARTVATAVEALRIGCDLPDAWMCFYLGITYDPACATGAKARCAEPNATLAARYRRLACQLAPQMQPCKQ